MDLVGEAEVQTRLLLARKAFEANDRDRGRTLLDAAYGRVMSSNNPLWMHWLDEAASELDPPLLSERLATRFSGRARAELQETKREDVTIIFADLVNFTPRTLELTPEEVMRTVRGLFELGVPLLTKHQVSPLTYMGDGLLAIAQGDDHAKRGLAFARELVARTGRMSKVRRLLDSGWPIDLRAGVATGPVVLGSLGTLFKTDFAAIGVTTNLAARLQAQAQPGEVMAARTTIEQAGLDLPAESLKLKGFEKWEPIEACRMSVYVP
jgi:class 3 adenylate cyclase